MKKRLLSLALAVVMALALLPAAALAVALNIPTMRIVSISEPDTNGTRFDDSWYQARFDEDGTPIRDEDGGWYSPDGNYHSADGSGTGNYVYKGILEKMGTQAGVHMLRLSDSELGYLVRYSYTIDELRELLSEEDFNHTMERLKSLGYEVPSAPSPTPVVDQPKPAPVPTPPPAPTPASQPTITVDNKAMSVKHDTVTVTINGQPVELEAVVLTEPNGGAHTYFKLRDVGQSVGFNVDWNAETGITVDSNK